MATRFFGWENATAPITPAVDAAWSGNAAPFAWKPMHTTARFGDTALTTVASFTSSAGQNRAHRSWIGRPMAAGNAFTTSTTFKAYAQVLESLATNNAISRIGVRIVNEAGTVVQATLKAVADYSTGGEWNTALRNKAFADGDVSAVNYTTVDGDRLVVEWGHSDTAGASISTSSRWGSTDAAIANLPEDETTTTTTMRPWFETSLDITFKAPTVVNRYILIDGVNTAGGNGTTNTNSGANRAWVTMPTAITGLAADWPTLNQQPRLNCAGTVADAPTATVVLTGIVTSPDCFLEIIGNSPSSLVYSTSYYRIEPTKGFAPLLNTGLLYLRVSRLQAKANPPDGGGGYFSFNMVAAVTIEPADIRVDRVYLDCVINNAGTGGCAGFATNSATPNSKGTYTNIVATNFISSGGTVKAFLKTSTSTADIAWENCLAYNCGRGYSSEHASSFPLAKNCYARSCTDGYFGTFLGGSITNASDLASDAPGTSPRNSVTATFVSLGTDFHIQSSDTALKDQATDLSGDARLPFSTDGDGETRSGTWDIGPDEYVAVAVATKPPPFIYTNQSVQRAANW